MTAIARFIAALLALASLARLPALLALDDGDGDGGEGDGGEGEGDGDGSGEGDGGEGDGDGDGDGEGDGDEGGKTFSQADVDQLIDRRLARERRKHERELTKIKEAGKGDGDGDGRPDPKVEARITTAQARVVKTEAKAAALAAGVDPKRVARFLRLVDLDDPTEFLGDDDEPDEDAIAAAVDEALDDTPEFKAATGDGDGGRKLKGKSGTDGMTGDGKTKTWTRAEIEALSPEEIDKHWDSIQAALAAGAVK